MMNNLLELCEVSQDKLGRRLEKKEIEFLKWLYERYEEEKLKTNNLFNVDGLRVS